MKSVSDLLRVRHISASWGLAPVLHEVSLTLTRGTITALLGANGAGKSSTLLALSGLLPLTSGEIWLGDERLDLLPPSERVRQGLIHVPEGRRIFARMSVFENLQMGAYLRSDGATAVSDDIDKVFSLFGRLKERRTQLAGTLSGGEQQMLALGRALMARPRVLLLDEPSLGLAPLVTQAIFTTIQKLSEENMTILLVEQNARLALSVASQGCVLEQGTLSFTGPARQMIDDSRLQAAYLGHSISSLAPS